MTQTETITPARFREVLGGYPTGVSVITASDGDARYGMVVGSFTSISLDPPLVGFFPDKASRSWIKIERTGRFCVNVLGAHQLEHCKHFSSKVEDKFAGRSHSLTPGGLPLLDDALVWIECEIAQVIEIGDHLLVIGAVSALDRRDDEAPLLFYSGSYHSLKPLGTE
jgi:3-hydroxy-9,10-secoandrosta-1,3,5(10)-triene-9,17-dione monooxygenase reductase component